VPQVKKYASVVLVKHTVLPMVIKLGAQG